MMFEQLEQLAKAATPAPWLISDEGQEVYTTALSDDLADTVAETLDTHDAEFIAAANPEVILRLIEELRLYKVLHAECEVGAQRAAETRQDY